MKFSEVLHVISVIVGFLGIGTALVGVYAGADTLIYGLTREHLLFCSMILFLVAIWVQLATIHHMMLEKHGRIL